MRYTCSNFTRREDYGYAIYGQARTLAKAEYRTIAGHIAFWAMIG
ncbi:MAG: hypothetical protein HKK67_13685 [Chlorobiaceae bacterium]|nr:hypothetical protein [Chlorobiaceae bacterium]